MKKRQIRWQQERDTRSIIGVVAVTVKAARTDDDAHGLLLNSRNHVACAQLCRKQFGCDIGTCIRLKWQHTGWCESCKKTAHLHGRERMLNAAAHGMS